ncbi:MAG: fumarylacetoacetate hydrolase family protein [Elusimicrobia bacterium]|nr:fumarylacetoacetate hydrolase family protein [Elusimicrobiota bacterium]
MILPGLDVPLGAIWCVGRNYAAHARELGNEVPSEPVVFLKPAGAALLSGGTLRPPADSARVDHEVELVAARAADGSLRMAVGIDFTARDVQDRLKAKGLPWTLAKARRGFAAFGPFVPARLPAELSLSVNGAVRQRGTTADMLWPVERLIAYLDETFGLGSGDVVFTGTPPGVGPVAPGDRLEASLGGGLSRLSLRVAER